MLFVLVVFKARGGDEASKRKEVKKDDKESRTKITNFSNFSARFLCKSLFITK